jgi:hypothetical protein
MKGKNNEIKHDDFHVFFFLRFQIMNSNDLVKDILKRDVDEQDRILKSTEVIKPCAVDVDLGNLLVWDPNVIDQPAYK